MNPIRYLFSVVGSFMLGLLLLFGTYACKSVGPIEVEKDKYDLQGTTVVDTIDVRTTEYTYYRMSTDQSWILIDTQTVYDGNQQITFIVLENTEDQDRMAKIMISGEDLTPKEIEIVQHPAGTGGVGQGMSFSETPVYNATGPTGYGDNVYVDESSRPVHNQIKTEQALVELPEDKSALDNNVQIETVGGDSLVNGSGVQKEEEPRGPVLDLSTDQVNMGAAEDLESDDIMITASDKWTLENKENWLTVIDADGLDVKNGEKSKVLKIKTLKANPALEPRKTELVFKLGELKKVIMVIQKPTDARLNIDQTQISLDGSMAKAKVTINIEALGTNFTITEVPNWLKVNPTSGKTGKTAVEISATDDNTSIQAKTASFMVSSTGNVIQKKVTVTQEFLPSPIQIEEMSGNLERDKESAQTFNINATKDWTINVPSHIKWFKVDVTSGAASEEPITVTVTATEDNPGVARKAVLQVISGKFKRDVVVIQEGDEEGDAIEETPPVVEEVPSETPQTEESAQSDIKQDKREIVSDDSSKEVNVTPELSVVSGTSQGEFMPYVLLGNPKLVEEDPSSTPASVNVVLKSNVDFIIEVEPFDNLDTFYTLFVNNKKYVYGDIIPKGNAIQLTFKVISDNIQKQDNSKTGHILFKDVNKKSFQFNDPVMGGEEKLDKLEIKQESYKFRRPYIKVSGLDFDGYNSEIVLGNPGSLGQDALPTSITYTVNTNTDFALTLLMDDGEKKKNTNFNVSYSSAKNPNKQYSYKPGDKLAAGEYTFTVSVKKNYIDPQGVGSRYTESWIFNVVEGKTLTPYDFLDMDNYSIDLSYFRELFLIEQENFDQK